MDKIELILIGMLVLLFTVFIIGWGVRDLTGWLLLAPWIIIIPCIIGKRK